MRRPVRRRIRIRFAFDDSVVNGHPAPFVLAACLVIALACTAPPSTLPTPGPPRAPTRPLPTLSATDICFDYQTDLARAIQDLRRDLTDQIADLRAVSASGKPPDDATAGRIVDRRDSLLIAISHFERPAPCKEGEPGRIRIGGTANSMRRATEYVNIASDEDDPLTFQQAANEYSTALAKLNNPAAVP